MPHAPDARKRLIYGRVFSVLLILLWLGVAAVGGPKFGEISEVATNGQSAFLPESAESTVVVDRLEDFQDSGAAPAIVVITTEDEGNSGASQVDPAALAGLPDQLATAVNEVDGTTDSMASPPLPSEDGEAVQIIVLPSEATAPADAVDALDEVLGTGLPAGLEAQVTGPAGFSADLSAAFAGIDGLLLLVAVAAVLVILILVYRSPFR